MAKARGLARPGSLAEKIQNFPIPAKNHCPPVQLQK